MTTRWWAFFSPSGRLVPSLLLLFCISSGLLSSCSSPPKAPVVSREAPAHRITKRPKYYRIKRGDTLYSIAWRFGLSYRTLARWNNIRPPYTIYPGKRLRFASVTGNETVKPRTIRITKRPPSRKKQAKSGGKQTASSTKTSKSAKAVALRWGWPAKGVVVQFFVKGDLMRQGIKIRGRTGQRVLAAEVGKVVYVGSGLIGYGRLIIIKHNKNYLSAYGYNRKILVKDGDEVAKGERVAEMGGGDSNKPLLHFEIRRNGTPVNPVKLLPRQH